jgi:hypothetical protein
VYASIVSQNSMRIALTTASLDNLEVMASDVQNAYLKAPTKEKFYTMTGLEFGPDKEGHPVLSVSALCGLCSSGARWHNHLVDTIRSMGFTTCLLDNNV